MICAMNLFWNICCTSLPSVRFDCSYEFMKINSRRSYRHSLRNSDSTLIGGFVQQFIFRFINVLFIYSTFLLHLFSYHLLFAKPALMAYFRFTLGLSSAEVELEKAFNIFCRRSQTLRPPSSRVPAGGPLPLGELGATSGPAARIAGSLVLPLPPEAPGLILHLLSPSQQRCRVPD